MYSLGVGVVSKVKKWGSHGRPGRCASYATDYMRAAHGLDSCSSRFMHVQKKYYLLFVYVPPLHSYPLACFSKKFITTVVLGNDVIPRYCLCYSVLWSLSSNPVYCNLVTTGV